MSYNDFTMILQWFTKSCTDFNDSPRGFKRPPPAWRQKVAQGGMRRVCAGASFVARSAREVSRQSRCSKTAPSQNWPVQKKHRIQAKVPQNKFEFTIQLSAHQQNKITHEFIIKKSLSTTTGLLVASTKSENPKKATLQTMLLKYKHKHSNNN